MLIAKCVCDFSAVAIVLSYIDTEIYENKKGFVFQYSSAWKGLKCLNKNATAEVTN
jgi:hypothetical protein